jgi:hypothetical protein
MVPFQVLLCLIYQQSELIQQVGGHSEGVCLNAGPKGNQHVNPVGIPVSCPHGSDNPRNRNAEASPIKVLIFNKTFGFE